MSKEFNEKYITDNMFEWSVLFLYMYFFSQIYTSQDIESEIIMFSFSKDPSFTYIWNVHTLTLKNSVFKMHADEYLLL